LTPHSGKNYDWHHIQGKNMIGTTFWKKKHDWHHILGKKHEWQHIFWETKMISSIFSGKTWLAAYSGTKNMISSTFWEKT
jgi:hypothetical protein